MEQADTIIAVFPDHKAAERAAKKLAEAGRGTRPIPPGLRPAPGIYDIARC